MTLQCIHNLDVGSLDVSIPSQNTDLASSFITSKSCLNFCHSFNIISHDLGHASFQRDFYICYQYVQVFPVNFSIESSCNFLKFFSSFIASPSSLDFLSCSFQFPVKFSLDYSFRISIHRSPSFGWHMCRIQSRIYL